MKLTPLDHYNLWPLTFNLHLTLAKTTVPSATERTVTPEQSKPRRKVKKAGSVAAGKTERRNSTSAGKARQNLSSWKTQIELHTQPTWFIKSTCHTCAPSISHMPPHTQYNRQTYNRDKSENRFLFNVSDQSNYRLLTAMLLEIKM